MRVIRPARAAGGRGWFETDRNPILNLLISRLTGGRSGNRENQLEIA
jgi:hypothetical protein